MIVRMPGKLIFPRLNEYLLYAMITPLEVEAGCL